MKELTRSMSPVAVACLGAWLALPCWAAEGPAAKTAGWRGNWTGLFPEADPPVQWARRAKGVVAGMTCQAAKPVSGAPPSGQAVKDGLLRDWLVLGPLDEGLARLDYLVQSGQEPAGGL